MNKRESHLPCSSVKDSEYVDYQDIHYHCLLEKNVGELSLVHTESAVMEREDRRCMK